MPGRWSVRAACRTIGAALAAVVFAGAPGASAQAAGDEAALLPPAPLNERVLELPGDPARPVTLQVTLFKPDGPGPIPLAVMNHGTPANGQPKTEARYRTTFSAYYFLSRGYAVALPMMRGFAGSGGTFAHHSCDVLATGLDNGRDIAAVINALAADPGIDTGRIVVAGQSFGGWNTLAFGTLGHAGIRGLVNFAGGMRDSTCPTQDASLVASAAYLGAHASVPSIWLYGDNDKMFPPATWRAMHQRYAGAGGKAELVAFGSFMDDAHQLLSHAESLALWTPKVDAFLSRIGLPGTAVLPKYLPTPFPPASHFAALDDAAAVPYLSEKGRDGYREFLRQPFTRAFAIAPNGLAASAHGGFDAIARVLAACQQHTTGCQLYAVDDYVVWNGSKADAGNARKAALYRQTVPAGATTMLDVSASLNPDAGTRGLPVALTVK